MGKRYYCEYCDKSFADNPTSRKTHLTGNSHIQTRKAHYDSFREEKDILNDDRNKKPCRSFLSTGECKFGERCQYSHLTNETRAQLVEIVRQKEQAQEKQREQSNIKVNLKESLDKWAENRAKRQKLESELSDKTCEDKISQVFVPEYKLADCLAAFPGVPPSLLPPKEEEILNSHYEDWGW
ncbi:unnamed protein product [Candidula unifasciata]|uniref:Zinc finger matrin-type protein 5 n=1 Tax=Candidula unifasciata TaxID=100452 RepID=A0A8S3Z3B5_9EUPU|nr:unnamed protein product [Candidula unifasciata]